MTNHTYVRAALLVVVIFGAAALVPLVADHAEILSRTDSPTATREIRLVVRDMTFYVDGQDTPNPTLYARPGDRIRLVLRNTEPGMSHDFTVASWKVATRLLKGKGEDAVEFTVPDAPGSYAYSCTPHAQMMNGSIRVR